MNLMPNLADALTPPPWSPPTEVSRETIRVLIQALGWPPHDVREVVIAGGVLRVQRVDRTSGGFVDGEPVYVLDEIPLT